MQEELITDRPYPPIYRQVLRDDPLSQLLMGETFHSVIHGVSTLTAPWGVCFEPPNIDAFRAKLIEQGLKAPPASQFEHSFPEVVGAMFAVVSGGCWLKASGADHQVSLAAGDVVIVTRPSPHYLRSSPDSEVRQPLDYCELSDGFPAPLRGGGGGEATSFIVSGFVLEGRDRYSVMNTLPPVIHVSAERVSGAASLAEALRLLTYELEQGGAGTVSTRHHLAQIVLTQAIRIGLMETDGKPRGDWFRPLHDPQINEAMSLIHDHPEKPWTVASLADAVGMGRSTFAAKFHEIIGESPMAYLQGHRLELACRMLVDTRMPVKTIALETGYSSVSSFSNAFKRAMGVSPRAYRSTRHHVQGSPEVPGKPTGTAAFVTA